MPDSWLHVRAFVIYVMLFTIPPCTLYALSISYGCTSVLVIHVLHSLTTCINLCGSVALCAAYYVDDLPTVNLWDNINDVVEVIEVIC
jgi:hypothetical protein